MRAPTSSAGSLQRPARERGARGSKAEGLGPVAAHESISRLSKSLLLARLRVHLLGGIKEPARQIEATDELVREAAMNSLEFHREMVKQALEGDCLVVAAKGLGHELLMVKLLQLECGRWDRRQQQQQGVGRSRQPLVFVLNGSDEADLLSRGVVDFGAAEAWCRPPVVLTNKYTSAERGRLYAEGGCFIVTSRILVVDLLTKNADPGCVQSVLVMRAHRATERSTEAFILRILRSSKSFRGHVRAFSDAAESLTGFSVLPRTMQALGVRRLLLLPRFHVAVRTALDATRPDVVEMSQPLAPRMLRIQNDIITLLDLCLGELKSTQNLDVSGLTVENGLSRNFEMALRKQLDPIWHQVPVKSKMLVSDVGVLRKLLPELLHSDAVAFLLRLDMIREEATALQAPPLWMLTDCADNLFTEARARVFKIKKRKRKREPTRPSHAELVAGPTRVLGDSGEVELSVKVEENPKVGLLRDVLAEIESEPAHAEPEDGAAAGFGAAAGCDVLLFCRDELTCDELRARLNEPRHVRDQRRLERFLDNKFRRFCRRHGYKALTEAIEELEPAAVPSGELRTALLRFLGDVYLNEKPPAAGAESGAGNACDGDAGDNDADDGNDDGSAAKPVRIGAGAQERLLAFEYVKTFLLGGARSAAAHAAPSRQPPHRGLQQGPMLQRPRLVIFPLSSMRAQLSILEELAPRVVILYEPDVRVVREVEVYQAANPKRRIRLYFLQYEDSVEEQRYLSELRREQEAFRKLIDDKAGLVLPTADRHDATALVEQHEVESTAIVGYNVSTGEAIMASEFSRRGKGRELQHPTVVVDMREFRSALPSMLHGKGVMVAPTTLEVGDYILAPEICVERKSIPDLFGSFNSGRLFTQAEAMCRYYERPNLLIEFDPGRPFSLTTPQDLGTELNATSIITKMATLTLHFPKLRILWSPDANSTVDLFKLLKANYDQPDPVAAARVGVPESATAAAVEGEGLAEGEGPAAGPGGAAGTAGADAAESANKRRGAADGPTGNLAAQELLRRLPGITAFNAGRVMREVRNLRELSQMSQPALQALIGKVSGARLFKFFNEEPDEVGAAAQGRRTT